MNLNRRLSAPVALAIVAGVGLAVWIILSLPQWIENLRPQPPAKITITKEAYTKIKMGMTLPEVQAIVGTPGTKGSDIPVIDGTNTPLIQSTISVQTSRTNRSGVRFTTQLWKNYPPKRAFVTISFVGGRVIKCEQRGL